MNSVKLGKTGLKVSRLCLGCMSYGDAMRGGHGWVLDEEASQPFFRQAIESGIKFFDTANAGTRRWAFSRCAFRMSSPVSMRDMSGNQSLLSSELAGRLIG